MQIENIVTGLNESAELIHKGNISRGFYDGSFDKDGFPIKNTGELLMLVVSELGEALEADRKNKQANLDLFEDKINVLNYQDISQKDAFIESFKTHIKDTFQDEIADSVIRLLDMCGYLGIDIDRHINLKLTYNSTRPYKHGKNY